MEEGDKPEAVAQASALGPEASPAAPAAPSAAAPDQHRREALRKAGADYLEKALAQSRRNPADHFAPVDAPLAPSASVPRPSPTASSRGRRGKQPQALDPDVAAFGQVFESTKLYVYMGLYLACQGAIYVLIKVGGRSARDTRLTSPLATVSTHGRAPPPTRTPSCYAAAHFDPQQHARPCATS